MERLSHRDRIVTILAGEKPDRWAASFWRHFAHMEHHAEGTAEAMLGFQRRFDWDFMKVNPLADYHVQDWGLTLTYSRDEFGKHVKSGFPVKTPADWAGIRPLPATSPSLAEHLKVVAMIRRAVGKELPILMTVFCPLAVAGRMAADDKILTEGMRLCPGEVHRALEAITATFSAFVSELRNAGADGVFFATTKWASSSLLTWEDYQNFGVPYDRAVLGAAESDALNLLHICSSCNFLEKFVDLNYPVSMYNWDSSDPTNLPVDKSYDLLQGKAVVGGVDERGWLVKSTPEEVGRQIEKLKGDNDPSRLIIGPGCAIPPETPTENLQMIRDKL
jgi:uroporphyrinogen decarboxylase